MTINAPRLTTATLALALLLAGCATTGTQTTASPAMAQALAELDGGQPRQAAMTLESLAGSLRGAARTNTLADAAWGWHLSGDSARARSLLDGLNVRHLSGASAQRHQLLQARLALESRQPDQALQWLAAPVATLPAALAPEWLLTRSMAQEATGDTLGAAASRQALIGLSPPANHAQHQRVIARLLAGTDDAALRLEAARLPPGDPLYNPLARTLLARGLPLPRPLDNDPLALPDLDQRPPGTPDGYRPPASVAVLLPLSGQLATAASPVRDGLLAAYYAESRPRPPLTFIDTQGTPSGALAAYERAVAAGAGYVIGPLGRDEVDALFARASLPVPVQALNHGNGLPPRGHLAFSLAPEDDGVLAADYLRDRERRQAVVIHSNDDNGRRAAEAFAQQFTDRAGQILATVAVSDNPADISTQLDARADAVFLAVRGAQARALVPQLAMAGLGGASKVASSQLTSGTGKASEDSQLDGIAFPGERWLAHGVTGLPSATGLAQRLPTARGAAARLMAFGFDAWQITAFPQRLAGTLGSPVQGATGQLYLDGAGKVQRRPAWSTFQGGHIQPLPDAR